MRTTKIDISVLNMVKRVGLILVLFCMSCLLCSCGGKKTVSVKNADGTTTTISFENHGTLTRAPVFTKDEKTVTMQFNGTEWYIAAAIGEKEQERIAEGKLFAESSNIRVYRNKSKSYYEYVYVIKLEGSDQAYIAVSSLDAPDQRGYGTDFDSFISYSVDGRTTVPDMDWKMVE